MNINNSKISSSSSSSRSNGGGNFSWTCSRCTLINNQSLIGCGCEACGLKPPDSSSISRAESNEREEDNLFDLAKSLFEVFVEVDVKDSSSPMSMTSMASAKQKFRCRLDGKVLHSKDIMIAYLVKNHATSLSDLACGDLDRNFINSNSNSNSNSSNSIPDDSDAALALQIALDDYDNHVAKKPRSSSQLKSRGDSLHAVNSTINSHQVFKSREPLKFDKSNLQKQNKFEKSTKRKGMAVQLLQSHSHSSSSDDDDDDDDERADRACSTSAKIALVIEKETRIDLEAKNVRLEKLLRRTDKLVENVNKVMRMMLEKHRQTQEPVSKEGNTDTGNNSTSCQIEESLSFLPRNISVENTRTDRVVDHRRLKLSLRDYQLGGVEWLTSLYATALNGILADEMGLGKTVQVISFLIVLFERFMVCGPHLIVMPLSVMNSWKGDLNKFVDDGLFNVYVHHGEKGVREECFLSWIRDMKTSINNGERNNIHLVLTSYEIAINDAELLRKLRKGPYQWEYLVVDEAHRLKNKSSILFGELRRINAKHRLLLTGTPLQNNLNELWALLSFILPGLFNDEQQFSDWFNRPFESDSDCDDDDSAKNVIAPHGSSNDNALPSQNNEESMEKLVEKISQYAKRSRKSSVGRNLKRGRPATTSTSMSSSFSQMLTDSEKSAVISSLHRVMKPFILRRLKSEVIAELPDMVQRVVICPLSPLQVELHNIFRRVVAAQESVVGSGRQMGKQAIYSFNNLLMQLRKTCNHPYLVLEDVQSIPDDLYEKCLVESSGKLIVLEKLLTRLIGEGSKVLIFSQMTTMLDILQGFLYSLGITCFRLDGSTKREDRDSQIQKFNINMPQNLSVTTANVTAKKDSISAEDVSEVESEDDASSASVFLLSTRAGGVGINLQAADSVILFDSDWNPQQDLQAISRAHRIGQTKTVLVLRFISEGPDKSTYSVEQKILKRATKKLEAGRQVLAAGEFDMGTTERIDKRIDLSQECDPDNEKLATRENLSSLFEKVGDDSDKEHPPSKKAQQISASSEDVAIFDRMDFSPGGIASICDRTNRYSEDTTKSSTQEDVRELDCIVGRRDLNQWSHWLQLIEPLEQDHSNYFDDQFIPPHSTEEDLGRGRRYKERNYLNENFIWKQVTLQEKKGTLDLHEKKKIKRTRQQKKKKTKEPHTKNASSSQGKDSDEVVAIDVTSDADSDDKSSSDGEENGTEEDASLKLEDICALCGSAWVYGSSLDQNTSCPLQEVMILCDGCDGSYHALCVGLDKVPVGDWFCRWCMNSCF